MTNKAEFIEAFRVRGYTKQDSELIYKDFIDTLIEVVVKHDGIRLPGLGTFECKTRNKRDVIHPTSGEIITIEEHKYPQFTPSKRIKSAVRYGLDSFNEED